MPRVCHFEVHADEPEAVIPFYEATFGWTFQKWAGGPTDYWMITSGPDSEPGINGGMVRRMGPRPTDGQAVNAYVCTVTIPNVDESLAKITSLGGTVALPKMPIPGVGWLAYAKDPAGNLFGIMQPDEQAK